MNQDWDSAVPSVEVWRKCLRVLKPGAFAFIMSSPRLDCLSQMGIRLQEAGFNVGFTPIYWAYASGFPKAESIGRAVDRRLGVKRTVVGTEKVDIGIQSGSMHAGRSSQVIERDKTVGTSPAAQALDGSYGGFRPKPAVEVIIVAMKPLSERTYVDQALKNQKGITWLDEIRIPITNSIDKANYDFNRRGMHERAKLDFHPYGGGWKARQVKVGEIKGRFPANLLVGGDALNDGKERTSCRSSREHAEYNPKQFKFGGSVSSPNNQYDDSGSFSRYFSLDAWWERKLKELPESVHRTFPFLIASKASQTERNNGLNAMKPTRTTTTNGTGVRSLKTGFPNTCVKNNHPTVKPLKLMSYLITLGSRKGDVILDPFCGTASSCIAAKLLGRRYVGIEISQEYCEIANARLGGAK